MICPLCLVDLKDCGHSLIWYECPKCKGIAGTEYFACVSCHIRMGIKYLIPEDQLRKVLTQEWKELAAKIESARNE